MANMCIWLSCDQRGVPTEEARCPSCGTQTEPSNAHSLRPLASEFPDNEVADLPGIAGRALIVTMNDIPGYRIVDVCSDVFGSVVMARNYFSNLGASMRTLVGGEVRGYTDLLNRSRGEARARLWTEARRVGGNAVVAFRLDCNEIGDIMTEVVAYGTAVIAERSVPESSSPFPTA